MILNSKIIFSLSCLALMFSCGYYSLTGSIPSHLKTVFISPIENQTPEFNLGNDLTQKFIEIFMKKNLLSLTTFEEADSEISLKIISLTEKPDLLNETITSLSVNQWKITIILEFTWYDSINKEYILNKQLTETVLYSLISSNNVEDNDNEIVVSRVEAINKCIEELSQRILNELISTW